MAEGRGVWTGTAGLVDNVAQFNDGLRRAAEAFPGMGNAIKRKAALEVLTRVIRKSPVDTGRFRDNWQASLVQPTELVLEAGDGAAAMASGVAAIASARPGQTIFISNHLPYAEALEDGHSKQAPHGVVGVTLIEVQGGLRDL